MDTVSIDPLQLHSRLGRPGAPLVVDVRGPAAFDADDRMIASAVRSDGDIVRFAAAHPNLAGFVVYCVHGHEVSQEAARQLQEAGIAARWLEGGIEAWKSAGHPTIRRKPEWKVPGGSHWITRARPKIDRIACPWLVRRFIDPFALFHYVPAAEVLAQASARHAIAYDIAGAVLTHRGERCSFDAVLEDFGLRDAALDRLATIVRGADTDRLDLAPESRPLLEVSRRLSERYADDHEMLRHAVPVYDDLYQWCGDEPRSKAQRWQPPA